MAMLHFLLNNREVRTEAASGSTVLDFIRHQQRLLGTKIGCREGDCGACTVLIGDLRGETLEYRSMTSCLMPLGNAHGKHIVTIEGLNLEGLSPVQEAIVAEGGTQCGFCTVGFVVSLTGFCASRRGRSHQDAVASMDGNICRCTGYKSLERAAARVSQRLLQKPEEETFAWLVDQGFLPDYFRTIGTQLRNLINHLEEPLQNFDPALKVLAGGTDLLVQQPETLAEAPVFLAGNRAPKGIQMETHSITIGGATPTEWLRESAELGQRIPRLKAYMDLVSSTPIRNMATVAGNFANASPIGDLSIMFLAMNASLSLRSGSGIRQIPLRDFFLDYKRLAKNDDELIENLVLPISHQSFHFHFEKVCKRRFLDIASVNSAMGVWLDGPVIRHAAIAAGGVAPIPKYLPQTSALLAGKTLCPELVEEVLSAADQEIAPISDVRGSAAYKRLQLKHQLIAHFLEIFPDSLRWEAVV